MHAKAQVLFPLSVLGLNFVYPHHVNFAVATWILLGCACAQYKESAYFIESTPAGFQSTVMGSKSELLLVPL